ncbi:hypothetical protein Ddye_006356 [Dipteronia dyeriana]|uniref:RING-type E3 ubiquitin transferase n=1 Tax=Dipteronia dyeriana TaxID=168575 RepID=A0AAD9XIA6_9ROSI|nr:hypothetical protein Ddye_006356 [Dipteronia dyeriana]
MKHRKLFPVDNSSSTNTTQSEDCITCYPGCNPDYCIPDVVFLYPPPPPPPPPPHHHHVSPYVIIFVCLVIFFFLFILFNVIRAKARAVNQANNNGPQQALSDGSEEELVNENRIDHPIWFITTVGLQPSTINSISVCKYKKGEGLIEGTECSVCLNEFQENETLRLLPKCNHAFHIFCIDTWLKSHTNCPMCRASIVSSSVTPAPLPVINQNSVSSNVIANSQIDNSEIDRQLGENQERNAQAGENRTRTEEGSERILKHSVNSNETDVLQVLEHDSQTSERSVSLGETTMTLEFDDFGPVDESGDLSADQINDAEKQDGEKPSTSRETGSCSSIVQCLHKSPVSMKRSVSSSTGSVLRNKNQKTILPL